MAFEVRFAAERTGKTPSKLDIAGLDAPLIGAFLDPFYCVLALAIAHLMRREAHNAGLHLSVRELLNTLAGVQETVLLYHDGGKGRPRARRMLTDMDSTQQRLADLFGINKFAPSR